MILAKNIKTKAISFRREIIKWHQTNKRKFPWRETNNPYHILMAELFLQRTRAEQATTVYLNFLDKFPTNASIPSEDDLSNIIGSLGLHHRIKRIHGILTRLQTIYGGTVPHKKEALDVLLGGNHQYVRNAVQLYAFGIATAPVDRIVARVLSRVFMGKTPLVAKPHTDPNIVILAENILPIRNCREYNLALLDFGALICKSNPNHNNCSLKKICSFYNANK